MYITPQRGFNALHITEDKDGIDLANLVIDERLLYIIEIAPGVTVRSIDPYDYSKSGTAPKRKKAAIYSSISIDSSRSKVVFVNRGNIYGVNGYGGDGDDFSQDGGQGGDAIHLECNIDVYNYGRIFPGGGGGAGFDNPGFTNGINRRGSWGGGGYPVGHSSSTLTRYPTRFNGHRGHPQEPVHGTHDDDYPWDPFYNPSANEIMDRTSSRSKSFLIAGNCLGVGRNGGKGRLYADGSQATPASSNDSLGGLKGYSINTGDSNHLIRIRGSRSNVDSNFIGTEVHD